MTSIPRPDTQSRQPAQATPDAPDDSGMPNIESTIARILQHLPMNDGAVPTLLKGHLLIDETLRKFLAKKVINPSPIEEAQLSFHQTCCVMRAIYPSKGIGWLWDAIKLLNRMRNDLAHHLEPNGLEQRFEAFQDLVDQGMMLPAPTGMRQQMGPLALTLAKLIAFIHVGLEPMPSDLNDARFF